MMKLYLFNLQNMNVNQLALPPDSTDIQFVEFCSIDGTIRIQMKIKGILFKRLHDNGAKTKPVWHDPTHHFEGAMTLDEDKSDDLEAIFQNYLSSMNTTVIQLKGEKV